MCVAQALSLLKTFLLVAALATVGLSQSQPSIKQREKLLMALKRSQSDTSRVNNLLSLGEYYMNKPGELQADINSAASYMKQAETLSYELINKAGKLTTNHINVLLKLSEFYCFKPLELRVDTDSAIYYAKEAERQSQFLHSNQSTKALELIGNAYWEKHDTVRAENYFKQAINQYEQQKDIAKLATLWAQFGGHIAHSQKNLSKKVNCYRKALQYYHQSNNQDGELEMIDYIYYTFYLQQQLQPLATMLLRILSEYRPEKGSVIDFVYYCLSITEINRGNYQASMNYDLKAIQLASLNPQNSRIGDYYDQISNIYRYLNNSEKRLEYSQKAISVFKKYNNISEIYHQAWQICQLLVEQKKGREAFSFYQDILHNYPPTNPDLQLQSYRNLAVVNEAIHKYDIAESYYLTYVSGLAGFDDRDPMKASAHNLIGQFYLNRKQYEKARYYFDWFLRVSSRMSNPRGLQITYQNLFKLDSAQGHFEAAIAHFQQYTVIKDSILTATKAKQIEELQIQYETQNKEHRINFLTTQAREQQARVQQATFTRNVTFAGATMLLVLLGLIYNRYRLKQTQQVQIQLKNDALEELVSQKEWLLKEIHHRVKNNLQLIISLLQSQGRYLLDKAAISAIEQSEHRVRAMALIHQKLYRTENLSKINMKTYIQEMAEQISDSFDPQKRIALEYDIALLDLDVSQAIPLGLIINEAITNAFKYAFPGERPGNIYLSLTRIDSEHYLLRVKDDGIGLPDHIDLSLNKSMGANIMRRLCKQLSATIQINSLQGVDISVAFTLFHLKPSSSYVA